MGMLTTPSELVEVSSSSAHATTEAAAEVVLLIIAVYTLLCEQ